MVSEEVPSAAFSPPFPSPHCQFHTKQPLFSAEIDQNAPAFGKNVVEQRPNDLTYAAAAAAGRFPLAATFFALQPQATVRNDVYRTHHR